MDKFTGQSIYESEYLSDYGHFSSESGSVIAYGDEYDRQRELYSLDFNR